MVENKFFSGNITIWESGGTWFAEHETELKRYSGAGESIKVATRRLLSQLMAEGILPWEGDK
jgi:hypothetical protein